MMHFEKVIVEDRLYLKLDVSEFDFEAVPLLNDNLYNLQHFTTNAYKKFRATDDDEGMPIIIHPVNEFFASLSVEDRYVVASAYLNMKYVIQSMGKVDVDEVSHTVDELNKCLLMLDDKIDLCKKIALYIHNSVPIRISQDIGSQPHDTAKMTFYRDEIEMIAQVALLCKLMMPIFSDVMTMMQQNDEFENSAKDLHCSPILTGVLSKNYHDLIVKLQEYIKNIAGGGAKKCKTEALFNCGDTVEKMMVELFAQALVRKLVLYDLFNPVENAIMHCIYRVGKYSTTTGRTGGKDKKQVSIRFDPGQSGVSGGDEGNTSYMELESKRTSMSMEVPLIIRLGIDMAIEKEISVPGFNMELFNEIVAYYTYAPVEMNTINRYLISYYFGPKIAGAKGIDFADVNAYNKMTAIVQMLILGEQKYDILHGMSALPSDKPKAVEVHADKDMLIAVDKTYAYKNCMNRFPYRLGDMGWDTQLFEIQRELSTTHFKYNTPPIIWNYIGEASRNSQLYIYGTTLLSDICWFLDAFGPEVQVEI